MLRVNIDTSPLKNENAHRGVGTYTKFLIEELKTIPDIEITSAKADIVHYPFFDLFFSTLPLIKKTKTIVTIHDVIPLIFPKEYRPGKKGFLSFLKQKIALKSVQVIITDSNSSKNDIVKYLGVKPEKVQVVYLAPNPHLQPVSQTGIAKTLKEFNLPSDYILYVGDINYNKNIPQLIKTLKFLPDHVHLVCVGKNFRQQEIPEWKRIELQLALSDVTDRVHFITNLGATAENDLAALYQGSVCYVQPSLYEGFGLPVTEAMQCETPVVCTQNSSLIEVAGDAAIFTQADAESIAEGIKKVLRFTAAERKETISKGKEWVKQFSWTRTAHETAILYRQVAEIQ